MIAGQILDTIEISYITTDDERVMRKIKTTFLEDEIIDTVSFKEYLFIIRESIENYNTMKRLEKHPEEY